MRHQLTLLTILTACGGDLTSPIYKGSPFPTSPGEMTVQPMTIIPRTDGQHRGGSPQPPAVEGRLIGLTATQLQLPATGAAGTPPTITPGLKVETLSRRPEYIVIGAQAIRSTVGRAEPFAGAGSQLVGSPVNPGPLTRLSTEIIWSESQDGIVRRSVFDFGFNIIFARTLQVNVWGEPDPFSSSLGETPLVALAVGVTDNSNQTVRPPTRTIEFVTSAAATTIIIPNFSRQVQVVRSSPAGGTSQGFRLDFNDGAGNNLGTTVVAAGSDETLATIPQRSTVVVLTPTGPVQATDWNVIFQLSL